MLKKLIAPFQERLLEKKVCPGCLQNLEHQYNRKINLNQTEQVTCNCGRIYIYDKELDKYRRAIMSEVR